MTKVVIRILGVLFWDTIGFNHLLSNLQAARSGHFYILENFLRLGSSTSAVATFNMEGPKDVPIRVRTKAELDLEEEVKQCKEIIHDYIAAGALGQIPESHATDALEEAEKHFKYLCDIIKRAIDEPDHVADCVLDAWYGPTMTRSHCLTPGTGTWSRRRSILARRRS